MSGERDPLQDRDEATFRSSRGTSVVVRPSGDKGGDGAHEPLHEVNQTGPHDVAEGPASLAAEAQVNGKRYDPGQVLEELADADIFVLLETKSGPEHSMAKVFSHAGKRYILIFEDAARAVSVGGKEVPLSQVPGRAFFELLQGRNVGIAVNVGDPSAETLVSHEEIDRFCEMLATPNPAAAAGSSGHPAAFDASDQMAMADVPQDPAPTPASASNTGKLRALMAPQGFPDSLQFALTDKLARVAKLCDRALLLRAEYDDGRTGFLVGFSGVKEANRAAIEDAVNDALVSSRRQDIELGIAFLAADDPSLGRISRAGTNLKRAP